MLEGKKILLGITGGIAAYKSAFLCRSLVKSGAEVRVVMTPSAHHFISHLTMATLSRNPVMTDFYDQETGDWHDHVEMGAWADLMLLAPLTANTMAKMCSGICDNLLMAVYLSAKCPVMVAPAMDLDMYAHPTTSRNMETLKSFGHEIIDAATGELASGLTGKGRMEEPENILERVKEFFSSEKKTPDLKGKKVLITAGPTVESIDPVRFISNHSTGTMGVAIANVFAAMGAEVVLVHGPLKTELHPDHKIHLIPVRSAEEMFNACNQSFGESDIMVAAAAVADYKPATYIDEKMKKGEGDMNIELTRTMDILATLGAEKKDQILVGFALETQNEEENAKKKLQNKNLDLIVLNSLKDEGAGFGTCTNKVSILDVEGNIRRFDEKPKTAVAEDIVEEIIKRLDA